MANQFYKLVNIIKSRLELNPLVNTIVFAKTSDRDLFKKNLYPLVFINPIPSPWNSSQTTKISFEVGVFNERNESKTNQGTKFEGNDNLLDNLNTCHAILNDLITWLSIKNNDDNIELISVSNFIPLLLKEKNLLDGYGTVLTLQIPNTIDVCLFEETQNEEDNPIT